MNKLYEGVRYDTKAIFEREEIKENFPSIDYGEGAKPYQLEYYVGKFSEYIGEGFNTMEEMKKHEDMHRELFNRYNKGYYEYYYKDMHIVRSLMGVYPKTDKYVCSDDIDKVYFKKDLERIKEEMKLKYKRRKKDDDIDL